MDKVWLDNMLDKNLFVYGYLNYGLLLSYNEDENQGDDDNIVYFNAYNIDEGSIGDVIEDCVSFQDENVEQLKSLDPQRAGELFWLSRNGHGTGFFDEDKLDSDLRDYLQDAANKYGEANFYVGDDTKLYYYNS